MTRRTHFIFKKSRRDDQVNEFGGRMDALERRMDALERRMDALERRMDALERKMDETRTDIRNPTAIVQGMQRRFSDDDDQLEVGKFLLKAI
jgi:chromosome segregation ATPase